MDFHKNARLVLADHSFTRRDILNICPISADFVNTVHLPVLTARTVEPISHRSNKYQVIVPQDSVFSVLFFDGPFTVGEDTLWDAAARIPADTGVYIVHVDSAQFLRLTWGAVFAAAGSTLAAFRFEYRMFTAPDMGVARVTACPSGRKRRPGERLMRVIRLSINDTERHLWLEHGLIQLPFEVPPPSEVVMDTTTTTAHVAAPAQNTASVCKLSPSSPVSSLLQFYFVVVDPLTNSVHVLNDTALSRSIIDYIMQQQQQQQPHLPPPLHQQRFVQPPPPPPQPQPCFQFPFGEPPFAQSVDIDSPFALDDFTATTPF